MPGARWRSKLSWNQVRYASVSFYPYICKFPANILHFCKHKCHIDVSMKPQIFFQTWLDGHLCIVFVKIKYALTSVPTFACLQKLALRDASPALNCLSHVHRARMGAQFSAGRVLENLIPRDRIGQYSPAGRDGHQIHPCRVRWIDSVKINPSLVMMREWHFLFAIATFHRIT